MALPPSGTKPNLPPHLHAMGLSPLASHQSHSTTHLPSGSLPEDDILEPPQAAFRLMTLHKSMSAEILTPAVSGEGLKADSRSKGTHSLLKPTSTSHIAASTANTLPYSKKNGDATAPKRSFMFSSGDDVESLTAIHQVHLPAHGSLDIKSNPINSARRPSLGNADLPRPRKPPPPVPKLDRNSLDSRRPPQKSKEIPPLAHRREPPAIPSKSKKPKSNGAISDSPLSKLAYSVTTKSPAAQAKMLRIVSTTGVTTPVKTCAQRAAHGSAIASSSRLPSGGIRRTFASSTARKAAPDVTLTVDGKEVTVPAGSALIQACEAAGSPIPRFCYHDRLAIAGNCRMCLVEVAKSPKPVASCAMPAMPGAVVFTNTPLVHEAREGVMEFLLANHPLDCPICDQGGECDLQDQSMRYGSDRTRFHEIAGKRAVENKDLGPLVKTVMTRCIQCTRCVRFANEVAGVEELGTTGRGNDMQIGMYVEKVMDSELSGNVVDLCPVGALTSKPYAFHSRPWELKNTESVDVLDAVGSNIRIDSRGTIVMRVQPRTNDDVNEEWINDKTRYSYDGLRFQRLDTPLIKRGDRFEPATWEEALHAVATGLVNSGAKGDEIKAIAGHFADTESLVAMKDFINRLGSDNLALDSVRGNAAPVHGVDVRSNYLFNSSIPGLDEADVILLVGTNPRHEAAVMNSRIRRSWLHTGLEVGLIGEKVDTAYGYDHLGEGAQAVLDFVAGKGAFAEKFKNAKKPMIIVGSAVTEHADGGAVLKALSKFVQANKNTLVTPEWNGFNVLQRVASHAAAYDIGFVPSAKAVNVKPKFVYLLNADEIDPKSIPQDAFVVYQGHHGDIGAQLADI
ncbi:NADH dehydrogenase (ubiquinone) 78K chain precursor, 5-prime end, partial [Serendipita sp. 399]